MNIDDIIITIDSCTKFHRNLCISGWLHAAEDRLLSIDPVGDRMLHSSARVGLHHGGVASLGANKGFDIAFILNEDAFPDEIFLFFNLGSRSLRVNLIDLLLEAQNRQQTPLPSAFFTMTAPADVQHILDVGGRARSHVDRSLSFPGKNVTVLDVLPGENVTVVGDAHEMSSFLPNAHFDAFLSISVFEHLLMPWKVAVEINRVLKPGGFGLVHTHQTLGMHDMPWDFWRFSDTAWDAIFNRHTGFEIVDRALALPSYILPLIYRDDKVDAERALGFEGSTVIVRKICESRLSWDVKVADIVPTTYPAG